MIYALTALFGIIGLAVGSYLNVVVLRMHARKQSTRGRSACPHCGHTLGWTELVPVASFALQRGRCRHCGKPISIQYPLVELATGLAFALAFWAHPFATLAQLIILLLWLYIIGTLIALAVYDLRWYLLPDKLLLPLIFPAAVILVAEAALNHSLGVALKPVWAAILFGGSFYLIAWVSKGRWMGGGDIKLAFIMGLLLGLQKGALALLLAFWLAALLGIALIAARRKKRTDLIPFGPFLIIGTIAAYLYGSQIIHWYVQATGLA